MLVQISEIHVKLMLYRKKSVQIRYFSGVYTLNVIQTINLCGIILFINRLTSLVYLICKTLYNIIYTKNIVIIVLITLPTANFYKVTKININMYTFLTLGKSVPIFSKGCALGKCFYFWVSEPTICWMYANK